MTSNIPPVSYYNSSLPGPASATGEATSAGKSATGRPTTPARHLRRIVIATGVAGTEPITAPSVFPPDMVET